MSVPTAAGLPREEFVYQARLDHNYVSGIDRGVRNPTVLILQELTGSHGVRAAEALEELDGA